MGISRVRTTDVRQKKHRREKIAVLTAYDAAMARILDAAGVDVLLVGDSVGMVMLGYDTTIPVTVDDMVHHTRAVSRVTEHALVVADLPFLSYQASVSDALTNAARLMRDGGANAVKLEGGRPVIDVVRRLVDVGIPVMGHLGLLPQSVHQLGGYRKRGSDPEEAEHILVDAHALQNAGAFAIVLEAIPGELARSITSQLDIPTIGIGAGPDCDGQVLVSADMLGLTTGHIPSFVKQYAHLSDEIRTAAARYVADVREGRFPEVRESATAPVR